MKFRLVKEYNAAKVVAGQTTYALSAEGRRIGEDFQEGESEISVWEFDAIEALDSSPAFERVEEAAGDVIAAVEAEGKDALSDRDLRAVLTFDDRPKVRAAVEEVRARRADEASAELAKSAEERRRDSLEAELAELDPKAVAARRAEIEAELDAAAAEPAPSSPEKPYEKKDAKEGDS